MFFFIFLFFNQPQDLQAPLADLSETLPHDQYHRRFYNASPEIRGCPLQNLWGQKMSKIRRDFWQLSTLFADISGTHRHVENLKLWIALDQLHFIPYWRKKIGELWSTNQKVIDAHVDPPNWTFRQTIFRPLGVLAPLTLQPPKMYFESDVGTGRPQVGLCPIFLVIVLRLFVNLVCCCCLHVVGLTVCRTCSLCCPCIYR